jgi:murein DD-endopeptidase MepM/ murein hydrolase activator NlpD
MASTRIGPATIAIVGLAFIAVGAAVKTGYIQIGRVGSTESGGMVVKTGAGDVEMPLPSNVGNAAPTKAPPTPPELATDSMVSIAPANDTNAVRPTADELSSLAESMAIPVAGVQPKDLLDTFDERRAGDRRHNALDIPAPRGTPVISAVGGKVLKLFTSQAGGLMVYASDPTNRFVLMYAHLDSYAKGLANDMPLQRGDTIGFVGTTGNAPPNLPHLHFAVARTNDITHWWTGLPVDPRPLLRR